MGTPACTFHGRNDTQYSLDASLRPAYLDEITIIVLVFRDAPFFRQRTYMVLGG